jgi:UDP-GlcNAc:undecaprenyl-phosphate GlcNAc-1-phosphate transferase
MREYLITLLISAALCYLITPIVRSQAIRFGAVAAIRDRDIHSVPTARWGGVAMWASMALTFSWQLQQLFCWAWQMIAFN